MYDEERKPEGFVGMAIASVKHYCHPFAISKVESPVEPVLESNVYSPGL